MKFGSGLVIGLLVGVVGGGVAGYLYRQHEVERALDKLLTPSLADILGSPAPSTYAPSSPPPPPSWRVSRGKSSITDDPSVVAQIDSPYQGRFGPEEVTLVVRCSEKKTAIYWHVGQYLGDDSYGDYLTTKTLTMRLDDGAAEKLTLSVSDDDKAAGYFSGAKAIALIKRLAKADRMISRIAPASSNSIESSFDLTGLRPYIAEMQEACGWK